MTRRKKPPRRGTPRPDFRHPPLELIPQSWTDAQAIAIYDFCSVLQELVWRRYEDVLVDAALQLQASAPPPDERTWPLPFDDEDLTF